MTATKNNYEAFDSDRLAVIYRAKRNEENHCCTLYNPETGAILGRTPAGWRNKLLYHCGLYSILASLWYSLFCLMLSLQPTERPTWIMEESLIGSNPGIGFRPRQPAGSMIISSIIRLSMDDSPENYDQAQRYSDFLAHYDNDTGGVQSSCKTDLLGPECGTFPYGYLKPEDGQGQIRPCIILKLNKIIGWQSEPYTQQDLPLLPSSLHDKILLNQTDKVYVSCEGSGPADKEVVSLSFFPKDQSFNFKPYTKKDPSFLSPIMAVRIDSADVIPPGLIVRVECKVWTKYKSALQHSSVNFNILLDL